MLRARAGVFILGVLMVLSLPLVGRANPVRSGIADVQLDWSAGVMMATGAAMGDIRAPSAALARVKAQRVAETRARGRLANACARVPGIATNAQAKTARTSAELARVRDVRHASDGSVIVTMELPIDLVRTAIWGLDPIPGEGLAALVVTMAQRPGVGLVLAAEDEVYRGPVLFFDSLRAARDRFGKSVPVVPARRKEGTARIDDAKLVRQLRAGGGVLVVVPPTGT